MRALNVVAKWITIAGLAVVSFAAQAQLSAGKEYLSITPPQPTPPGKNVAVIEFYWYGCPHCYAFDPFLNAWVGKLPSNVVFKRVPAIFNEQWGIAGRVFYALEAINEEQRVHTALFDAIHKDGLRITDAVALECVKEAVGSLRVEIDALLSLGLPNSPMAGAAINTASGNYITAQPYGVRNGVDFQYTGAVRKVDAQAIKASLDAGNITIVSNICSCFSVMIPSVAV